MRFFQRNKVEFETAVPHQPDIGPLSRQIAQAFSRQEIRDICFDLAIDPDEMPEKAKTEQCSWLIENLQRAGRLPELLSLLQKKRPQFDWQRPIVPTPRDLRNRDNLLQNVKTTWIEGFLQKSLSQAITIELNLSYQPEATARKSLYTTGQSSDLMADHDLMAVFHKYGRSLLILGEPGSGKTITMLQLAEALIAIAQDDPSQPVPVILNLSSWAQQKQPLQEWLVEELFLQYGMSRKLSRTWISQNLLLYLLDGLDEVAAEARDACVQAINYFKAAHPAELVVCSRLADYEQLQEKLNVATAVRLHLLTDDQIQTYLSHPELELTAVRDALATDPNLNELAHSPLFLNIMTLAYRGFTREQLQSFGSLANRRKHLFDTYVDEMFRRRPLPILKKRQGVNRLKRAKPNFSQEELLCWLTQIANGMKAHSHSVFYLHQLQQTWLSKKGQFIYRWLVGFTIGVLISWFTAPGFSIYISLIGAWSYSLFGLSRKKLFNTIITGIVCYALSLYASFLLHKFNLLTFPQVFLGLVEDDGSYPSGILSFILSFTGLVCSLFVSTAAYNLHIVVPERWKVKTPRPLEVVKNFVFGLLTGGLVAILISINFGVFYTMLNPEEFLPATWLVAGVVFGLFLSLNNLLFYSVLFSLTGAVLSFLKPEEIKNKKTLGEEIPASVRNGLISAIIGMVIVVCLIQLKNDIDFGATFFSALIVFIPFSFFFWFGGLGFVQHLCLRIVLKRKIPIDATLLEAFFKSACERLFVNQVGNGWSFSHRYLFEYFATLHPDAQPPAGSVQYDNLDTNLREV